MKKAISFILALVLAVSFGVQSFAAVNANVSGPTAEEATKKFNQIIKDGDAEFVLYSDAARKTISGEYYPGLVMDVPSGGKAYYITSVAEAEKLGIFTSGELKTLEKKFAKGVYRIYYCFKQSYLQNPVDRIFGKGRIYTSTWGSDSMTTKSGYQVYGIEGVGDNGVDYLSIKSVIKKANYTIVKAYVLVNALDYVVYDPTVPNSPDYSIPDGSHPDTFDECLEVTDKSKSELGCVNFVFYKQGNTTYLWDCGSPKEVTYPKALNTPKLKSAANTVKGVSLKWNKVANATGYYIYRKAGNATSWTKIATVKGGSTVSYVDTKVKSGYVYTYTVKAYASRQYSGYNSTGLKIKFLATPRLNSATSAKAGITVKYSKISAATGYIVYRKTASSGWSKIATISKNSVLSYLDKTAKKGTTYTYTVKAYYGKYYSSYYKGISCKDKY